MGAIAAPASLSPENQVELATVARMLELASGFVLAFVRVNHASLRERLVEELSARLAQKKYSSAQAAAAAGRRHRGTRRGNSA